MPHMLSPDIAESSRSRSRQRARTEVSEHRSMWDRLSLQKIGSWLKREDEDPPPALHEKAGRQSDEGNKENGRPHSSGEHAPSSRAGGLLHRRMSSRKVVPGLPRPLTFKRMNSEKRDKLLEVPVPVEQRRAASADRRASTTTKRNLSPPPVSVPSMSAPDVLSPHNSDTQQKAEPTIGGTQDSNIPAGARQVDYSMDESMDYLSTGDPPPLDLGDAYYERDSQHSTSDIDDSQLQEELEAKWILNLSMHFRDMSDREKFFITFAEEPNRWRRVTVSCDYRQLEPDSLEADLKSLHYQRDKSARIYEAIRDSLPDIQFYDTVTNLKLQTSDGRLHVHVTEDVNEIIPYPSLSAVDHLECKKFTENAVCFDSHISGFVYKVSVNNKSYIKKEIPGPDAVEEFLYEINALSNLQDSKSVIKFEGIIIDEKSGVIKGLLISYADQGALVDLVYDYKNTDNLIWERRERWARQIVEGLSEIHEAGFVQGDFTLSNIVIDRNDNAKIIDINRRGCPVGWEPPELARLIESGQRISIYIGVKSDLFQLGMVLWALAEQEDEPERQDRPLTRTLNQNSVIPEYFKDIIRACLSMSPKERPAAKDLLARFPELSEPQGQRRTSDVARHSVSTYPNGKAYIDPATAAGLDDISDDCQQSRPRSSFSNVHMPSTEYIRSSGSYILPNASSQRGRSSAIPRSISGVRRVSCSPFAGRRSVMSLDDSELENELASLPASRDTRWEQVYVDGDTKLVQRGGGGEIDVQDFAHQDPKDVCITTPPGELENSFVSNKTSEDTTPLNLSTVAELQPIQSQLTPSKSDQNGDEGKRKSVGNKASFSDRVHQLAHAHDSSPSSNNARANSHIPDSITLADLENEIALDSSIYSSGTISRTDTGFSTFDRGPEHSRRAPTSFSIANGFHSPPHQDSGFDEGNPVEERVSYESERIRQSLEMSMKNFQQSKADDECVNERLWDEKDGTMIGEGVRGNQLIIKPESIPVNSITIATMTSAAVPAAVGSKGIISIEDTEDKALEEKTSNTTIRPPSILIPEFHHGVPKAVESLDTNPSAAMQATGSSPHQQAASGQESYKTNHHRPFT